MSMRLDDINIGIQSQFHMLRHFVGITPELRDELLAAGRTKEAIEKELPKNIPHVFISSVTGLNLTQLKDLLWSTLNTSVVS